ncbi:MAG: LPS export ABC transporter periplasmic protein LptC [Rhodobiaceae bacterium]|nr:LPS export ABC transporter periplasmic protein LptC [Rhodobiaceae bacterium]
MTDTFADDFLRRQTRAFRAARRHTVFVRILRLTLPGLALFGSLAFVVSILWRPSVDFPEVSFDSLKITDGALVMEGPRLSGIDREARAYTLSADQASQKIGQTEVVDLTGIDATMAVDKDMNARVQSAEGTFNQKDETLYLYDGVDVSTNTGYKVRLKDAHVDLDSGTVTSDEPVSVDMLNGTLDAKGITLSDRGEVVTFKGRVKMVMQMHGRDQQ